MSASDTLGVEELRAYARAFPSQGGVEIGAWLERYAAEVAAGSEIVEMGSWLGAGTAQLALGVLAARAVGDLEPLNPGTFEPVIHSYDAWRANAHHVKKAAARGVALIEGEDTLPFVRASLRRFERSAPSAKRLFCFHKGKIKGSDWHGLPVGLYVDDACKQAEVFAYAMKMFRPYFIPGQTILVLMDFYFGEKIKDSKFDAQKRYMKKHEKSFTLLEKKIAGTSTAVFRFLGDRG